MTNNARFRDFVSSFTTLVEAHGADEAAMLADGGRLLEKLVAQDDWLPESCAKPHPQYYQQYLLHCDPLERFSVVSFVWGPGQKTPVHDHTVWGLVGVMRGTELCRRFRPGSPMAASEQQRLERGTIDRLSPGALAPRDNRIDNDELADWYAKVMAIENGVPAVPPVISSPGTVMS